VADERAQENLRKILASPSYIRAQDDVAFIARPEMRGVRLQLELSKTETVMKEEGVRSTIVVFGSARLAETSPFYQEAREFARIVSTTCQIAGFCDFVITTGGGPGVMEAANRGAFETGGKSAGLNILLPREQTPNAYITPSLCFQFHYFGIRKMHFLIRAKALVAFPGGFGTLDELFETLTLIQTGKMRRVPVILVSRAYWDTLINWKFLVDQGTIAASDLELIDYAETAVEAWKIIVDYYGRPGVPPAVEPDPGLAGR
jgi:uncharacterized protein (TIGR00730 family)